MADVEFEWDKAGLIEICKSAEMQAALAEASWILAARANRTANPRNIPGMHLDHFEVPPYASHVDVLDRTAVGAVHTNSEVGRIYEGVTHTLPGLNH